MLSKMPLVVFGLVCLSILARAAPLEPMKQNIPLPEKAPSEPISAFKAPTTTAATSMKGNDNSETKKKRNIEDYIPLDAFLNDDSSEERDIKIAHKLHPEMKETPAQIHDNAENPVDTDNARVFTEIKMNPNDLVNLARRRRRDQTSQRRKRALSSYELYGTDPLFASIIERQQLVRPARTFSPIYWYPSAYERSIRSADDLDDDQDIFVNGDDDDDERYPIFYETPNNLYHDTSELQPNYDIYDDGDDDFLSLGYEPVNDYVKK